MTWKRLTWIGSHSFFFFSTLKIRIVWSLYEKKNNTEKDHGVHMEQVGRSEWIGKSFLFLIWIANLSQTLT